MTQIVINARHGGFGLSEAAMEMYRGFCREQGAEPSEYDSDIPRDCPRLLATVKALGERAGGTYARLKIVTIPDDVDWTVMEYDGCEWVAEAHRTWS
jgi:hypothetical protein